jgi:hypothetical protein
MSSLDFLSTGNTEIQISEKQTHKLKYDRSIANPEQSQESKQPYTERARELAKLNGFEVTSTLKEAIEKRASGKRVVSPREADILLRANTAKDSIEFIVKAMRFPDSFITEDDEILSRKVFELRSRYNKGLEWKKSDNENRTQEQREKGSRLLVDILSELYNLSLPAHQEEMENGFETEFLKPEYLTWTQFTQKQQSLSRR